MARPDESLLFAGDQAQSLIGPNNQFSDAAISQAYPLPEQAPEKQTFANLFASALHATGNKVDVAYASPGAINNGLTWLANDTRARQIENAQTTGSAGFAMPVGYNQQIASRSIHRNLATEQQPADPAQSTASKNLSIFRPNEMHLFFGVNHGHSLYSDGLSLPADLYQKAIDDGLQFLFITEHNHWKARKGVEDDARKQAESNYQIVAENPQAYFDEIALANQINKTHKGTFVAGVGVESGTIGKQGSDLEGGVNHFAVFESPKFIRAGVDNAHPLGTGSTEGVNSQKIKSEMTLPEACPADCTDDQCCEGHSDSLTAATGRGGKASSSRGPRNSEAPPPLPPADNVIDYDDGNTNQLISQLGELGTDLTGGRFVIDLCHPRFVQDFLAGNNPNPGRDYGIRSFNSLNDWVNKFGRYVSMLEIIKGEALNPNPVDHMKSTDCDPRSFAGYIHLGIKAGPVVGRDFHFADPGGRPAYTGALATTLDMDSLMEAFRERRTIATTNMNKLQAIVTANDDKYVMGNVIDQTDAKNLNMKVKIGGQIDENADYYVKLYSDTTIGDGDLKSAVNNKPQVIAHLSGAQLNQQNDEVLIGNSDIPSLTKNRNAAYWVEVDEVNPNDASDQASTASSSSSTESLTKPARRSAKADTTSEAATTHRRKTSSDSAHGSDDSSTSAGSTTAHRRRKPSSDGSDGSDDSSTSTGSSTTHRRRKPSSDGSDGSDDSSTSTGSSTTHRRRKTSPDSTDGTDSTNGTPGTDVGDANEQLISAKGERCWTSPIFVDQTPALSAKSTIQLAQHPKNLYELATTASRVSPYYRAA